jgi:SAM-dependent methyltransferase
MIDQPTPKPSWDERYGSDTYLFGKSPNAFLASQASLLRAGQSALSIADGEGRNGVWLAQQGLEVLSVDASGIALEKARRLALERQVDIQFKQADLLEWDYPDARFDVVIGIFIQFAGPAGRERLFAGMQRALKPGGLLLLEGYRPEQLVYGTGGPPVAGNMYTPELLRTAFAGWEIILLNSYDTEISEGSGHKGMSALIDLVARKPA